MDTKKRKNGSDSIELLTNAIVAGMQEKKAHAIKVLDLSNTKNAVTNYFVLCSGKSDVQVAAIADGIMEQVQKQLQEKPWKKEGIKNREWILLDYVNVVVHVFQANQRDFYALDALWSDAPIVYEEA